MTNNRKPYFVNGIFDPTALTRKEFNFLVQIIDKGSITPMLDGADDQLAKKFCDTPPLLAIMNAPYVGGGDVMYTYAMKPKYVPFFGTSPEEFAWDPAEDTPLNTRDLVGAMEIIYLVAEEGGKASQAGFRVKITKVRRSPPNALAPYFTLSGTHYVRDFKFDGDWKIPDQDVELRDDGSIEVKDQDGAPYILEFKYVAPVTRDIVDKILDGRLGWKHDNTLTS